MDRYLQPQLKNAEEIRDILKEVPISYQMANGREIRTLLVYLPIEDDVTLDTDDIQEQINKMLADSPEHDAEEYAIHDYEGFDGYGLGEYECIETAHEIACFIDENPEIGGELLNNFGGDLEDARKSIEENYCGCYKTLADYAEELTEETTPILLYRL